MDQKAPPAFWNHKEAWVCPSPAHPLAELHADGGPVAAPAAQEAAPLPVPTGGIGTQLAPAPACRHKAEGALLQVTFILNTESQNGLEGSLKIV